jgi:hypothetical protein
MKLLVILLGLSFSSASFAATGGTVILLRGTAKVDGAKSLALKDAVRAGSTIKTEAKSFVKILFADQTTMNIGPDTTLKIEETKAGDPSLVNLVGGQIRAKVTKDLLQGDKGGSPEKMLIKTKTAAMGIRGTDFSVSFNAQNQITALITFEGNVAMARSSPGQDPANVLSSGNVQSVGPGQFSGAQPDLAQASTPVKISPVQLETLKANESFQGLGEKTAQKSDSLSSPIPPGVNAQSFSSAPAQAPAGNGPPPEGFFDAKSGAYAPRAGGYIDLSSGRYIPPPPGSSFDPNTGVYVPPKAAGQVDPVTGMYVPPKGVELDPVKGFVPEKGAAASPAQAQALATALNFAVRPDNAGKQVSFDKLFTPNAAGAPALPPPPPPPPPPGQNAGNLPPPINEPVDDPTCPSCILDNIQQNPLNTNVQFNITVQ